MFMSKRNEKKVSDWKIFDHNDMVLLIGGGGAPGNDLPPPPERA